MNNKFVIVAGLIVLTIVSYARVLGYGFINLDDAHYIGTNYYVKQGLTLEGIQWAFVTNRASNWHPLTWLSLMLDAEIFGVRPWGFHLTNLLLHTANAVLLFWVFLLMTDAPWKSAFVAAVFALHPGHVESVAWVTERKDVLSTFFGFLTIWAYIRHAKTPKPINYWMTVLFFILSLLAKQMLVTLPLVLLLLDYWPLRRLRFGEVSGAPTDEEAGFKRTSLSELIWEKVPLLAQSAVFAAVTVLAQRTGGAVTPLYMYPMHVRIGNAILSYGKYLVMTFWPVGFGIYYPHPGENLPWAAVGVSFVALVLISLLCLATWRSRPYLLVGWLWYLGTLVPVIGFVQVGMQGMADRYLYIPMIGISMMVAWGIPSLIPEMPGKNAFLGAASTVCVAILAVLCWIQTGYWKNSGTLFEHTLKVAGSSPIGHSSLGQWYFSQQNLDAAIEQFEKAIELNDMVVLPRMNLGLALNLKGKYQEAFEQVDQAAKLAPNNYEVQHSLGVVLASLGRFDEAVKAHEKAIDISPEYSAAHNDLGLLYLQQDKLDKAIEQLAFAMRYDPEAVFIRVNLSNALLKKGKPMDALQLAGSALQIRKDFPEGYIAAANALIALKKFDQVGPYLQAAFQLAGKNPRLQGLVMKSTVEFSQAVADANLQTGKIADAIGNYQDALKIAPNDPRLHNSLGSAYAMSGNIEEAIKEFNETFRLDPKSAEAKRNLGQAYLSQDKAKEAVEAFRTAIELAPDWPVPKNDLAWVLATYPNEEFRNGKEAVELAETACKQVGVDSPEFLDTLAAAYAESGDFAKAVANATKAADIALKAGRVAQSEELSKRLDQYKAGQPYHVEPTKPPESPAPPVSDTPAPDNGGALGEPALGTEPLDLGEPLIPAPGEPVQGITP